MTDDEWMENNCESYGLSFDSLDSCDFIELVGIKVDSGIQVDEARKQAFKEIYG
jgi:hypothetical protein